VATFAGPSSIQDGGALGTAAFKAASSLAQPNLASVAGPVFLLEISHLQ